MIERIDPKDKGMPKFLQRMEVLDRKSGTHLGHGEKEPQKKEKNPRKKIYRECCFFKSVDVGVVGWWVVLQCRTPLL